jgi:hypothetical protein
MSDKDPKPAPEGDKEHQAKVRAAQIKKCTEKVKPPKQGGKK